MLSYVQLFATPWSVALHAPLSMGFSRQEYWSRLPCSPPGDLPNPGIELRSHTLQVDSLLVEPPGENVCHISYWRLVIYELCVYIYAHIPTQVLILGLQMWMTAWFPLLHL